MKKLATSDLLRDYIELAGKRLDRSTIDLASLAVRRFVDFAGDVDVNEITLDDAELFHSFVTEDGCEKTTANNYIRTIACVFRWGIEHGRAANNPFSSVKRFKISEKAVRVYTVDELRRLLDAARGDEVMLAYIWQGLNTLRKSEIMNLTIYDIDFEANTIKIQPKYRTKETWPWEPKNRKVRIVPMADVVAKMLINRINALPAGQPYVNLGPQRYGYLRSNMDSLTERQRKKPFQNFDRNFRRLRKRAYVEGDFHQLRKTGLTMLLEQGERIHVVQAFAGHSSIKTTQKYIGLKDSYLSGALVTLNRVVSSVG